MPITREQIERGFQSLSTRYGGSLLFEKQLLNQNDVVVFIGLGGLGGRAVNAIKAAAKERLDNPDRRFFLVVDTCRGDMDSLSAVTRADMENPDNANSHVRGCIDEDEKLPLYNGSYKIKTLGHDIDSWLNRDVLGEVDVDEKGAQGIRQIGRVMLMANGNYSIVYNRLSETLNEAQRMATAKGVSMKVYIVAGISGGTGSGTIVDFTYMVKRAMSGFAQENKKIDAILFTPDVQFEDSGIDDDKKKGLKANFYAAMKEIDFFFNNKARKVAYKCPYSADCAEYSEDIFDFCTLVSRRAQGVDVAENSDGVIKKVADALTFEISGIKGVTDNGTVQSYSSFFSNVYNNFQLWWNGNGQNLNIPDWVPTRYSSFAYSSFYVPRDELIAYCANLLMEKLVEQWERTDITEKELKNIFRTNHIASNKAFASKLFDMAVDKEKFEVDKSEMPYDGFGLATVKNCESYLDTMRNIANEEGRKAKLYLEVARRKQDATFVTPIISLVDDAFSDSTKGPVYAINLLSAGISQRYRSNSGVLAWIAQLITSMPADVQSWSAELELIYADLKEKADKYDGLISVEDDILNSYVDDCRKYGKNLLKCKLLSEAKGYLVEIYNKLNDKNNRVYNIYTYAFEFLVKSLNKDSAYVVDTNRHREGQTTIFSFDLTNFQDGEQYSERFKQYFADLISHKSLEEASRNFVEEIFVKLKNRFDPAAGGADAQREVQVDDVVEVIRKFFRTTFNDFTTETIEKFCVIAYSNIDITADALEKIWKDNNTKNAALTTAAEAIRNKIMQQRRIMLNGADTTMDLQNFCKFETFAVLPQTPDINANYTDNNRLILSSNWSEFIGFKRIFGFPISLLADLDDYKKEYDGGAINAGVHLKEMFSESDGIDDWRYSLPDPYNYPIAKFLNKYKEGGKDPTEYDRRIMADIQITARKALALGILTLQRNAANLNANADANTNADTNAPHHAEANQAYYALTWKLVSLLTDDEHTIYDNICRAVAESIRNDQTPEFFKVLSDAGYRTGETTSIQWTFMRPEYNVMQNRTEMGDNVNFGNFIILLRSNPYWRVQLENGVKLFGRLHDIYQKVLDEFNATKEYESKIVDFMRAIRVGRVTPFYDNGEFRGLKIKIDNDDRDSIVFSDAGLDSLDRRFLIYNCFTERYMTLNDQKYNPMKTLVDHEFSESRVDFEKSSIDNVTWFIEQAHQILNDRDFMAHYNPDVKREKVADGLKYSRYSYSLPEPSDNRRDLNAIIRNVKSFYEQLEKYLEENKPKVQDKHDENSWTCECGQTNTGKCCSNCGEKKPEPVSSWTCVCGQINTGKFCSNCGEKKPEPVSSWTCECGQTNTGNFCSNCGRKKPESVSLWTCECGQTNTGNFCMNCGKRKG